MDSSLIEILIPRTTLYVSKAVSSYEAEVGNINNFQYKQKLEKTFEKITVLILEKIQNDQSFSIEPIKIDLLESVIDIGVGTRYPVEILDYTLVEIKKEVDALSKDYSEFTRTITRYTKLVKEALLDINLFLTPTVLGILQSTPAYQFADKKISLSSKDINYTERKAYPLFSKSRYWETFQGLSSSQAYSPLRYNTTAQKVGRPDLILDINYRDSVIKDGDFYKLNADVQSVDRNFFQDYEWSKNPKSRLSSEKKFNRSFDQSIKAYYSAFSDYSQDINQIISDSKIESYNIDNFLVDADSLTSTFGGEGKSIYQSIKNLKDSVEYLGGYEGSVVGAVDYLSKFVDYILAAAYGRDENNIFASIGGVSTFGRFDLIFSEITTKDKIPGLSFLEGFMGLKSYVQDQPINTTFSPDDAVVSYNPISAMFSDGLRDRFKKNLLKNSYSEYNYLNLILPAMESIYRKSLYCGDLIFSALSSLDEKKRLSGFEGLGSVHIQFTEFQKVFPPSRVFTEEERTVSPGLTGAIKLLLDSYTSLQNSFVKTILSDSLIDTILQGLFIVNEQIKEIVDSINKLSIEKFTFIPNISLKPFNADNKSLIEYLKLLGFRDSEVNILNSASSFSELINFFAPLTDSSDLKSFFKGLELTQLIYELGGEEAIDLYLNFLYKNNDLDGLLNILSMAQKKQSRVTTLQTNKYPTLIGLLIGLTYAIDPAQLVKFSKILGENNLSLLEAISYLLQSGQKTIIKPKESIDMLQPVIDQVIQGNYADTNLSPDLSYSQANEVAPIALRQWTKVINEALGGIESRKHIEYLYDKAVGLTPKELLSILGDVSPNTVLGQILDGLNGGEFTRFLKYANLSGLVVKLSTYKNSAQLNNFKVVSQAYPANLLLLLDNLKDISNTIQIANSLLESTIDYTDKKAPNENIEALIYSQNKTTEVLNSTVSQLLSSGNTENSRAIRESAASGQIQESPGLGNSRLPNKIPVRNSITPEQFKVLFSSSSNLRTSISTISRMPSGLINNFIKFAESNKLINGVSTTEETLKVERAQAGLAPESGTGVSSTSPTPGVTNWSPITEFETTPNQVSKKAPMSYEVPKVYKDQENVIGVKSNVLGVSNLESPKIGTLPSTKLYVTFDPVESCKRFGGQNCEELYQSIPDKCTNNLNKSLYPEEYSIPGVSPSSIVVDRPLGTFNDYKPYDAFVPTSSYLSPPIYVSLLDGNVYAFGENGEPVLDKILNVPLTFSSGGGEVSEYNNTEFGVVEGSKAAIEKATEFGCASLKSPYDYQLCMNIMKCKRFANSSLNKSYLKFCPKYFTGGRAK